MSKPRHTKKKLKAVVKAVKDEYASNGKYTVPKKCIDCGATRMCKPQDAWQVKRCLECQAKKKGAKLKALITRVKSPEHSAEKRYHEKLAKLEAWIERTNGEMKRAFAALEEYKKKCAAEPKAKRIWPK